MAEKQICPECGKTQDQWKEVDGRGYMRDELLYCSAACAAESGDRKARAASEAAGEKADQPETQKATEE